MIFRFRVLFLFLFFPNRPSPKIRLRQPGSASISHVRSPRPLLRPGGLARLKARIKTASLCRMQSLDLVARAESFLTLPDFQRTMTGRRLPDVSRDAVRRLGGRSPVCHFSGDKRFFRKDKGISGLRFREQNPSKIE